MIFSHADTITTITTTTIMTTTTTITHFEPHYNFNNMSISKQVLSQVIFFFQISSPFSPPKTLARYWTLFKSNFKVFSFTLGKDIISCSSNHVTWAESKHFGKSFIYIKFETFFSSAFHFIFNLLLNYLLFSIL